MANYVGFVKAIENYAHGKVMNRAALANIRKGLSPHNRRASEEYLAKFCDIRDDHDRNIFAVVGGMMATSSNKKSYREGNFGMSMHKFRKNNMGNSSGIDMRMKRILNARTGDELSRILVPIARLISGSHIDYLKLLSDMHNWNEEIRLAWAAAYYMGEY